MHARLRVDPVEDGQVGGGSGLEQPDDLVADEPGLLMLVAALEHHQPLAFAPVSPEVLGLAAPVVSDESVGRFQDRGDRAVVLLQLDDRGVGKVVLEAQDVPDVGSPPRVHRLVVITDHGHLPVLLGEKLDQHVLRPVGVLILIHQNVAEEVPVVGQPVGEELQYVDHAHQKVVEVQGVCLEQTSLVAPVDGGRDVVEAGRAVVVSLESPADSRRSGRPGRSRPRRSACSWRRR